MSDKKDRREFEKEFVTERGITLTLRWIPPLKVADYERKWKRNNPLPVPPLRESKIGNRLHAVPDTQSDYFKLRMQEWQEGKAEQHHRIILELGVKTQPPDDWQPDPQLLDNEITSKLLWLNEILTLNDIENIAGIIGNFNQATTEAIADEEKKS